MDKNEPVKEYSKDSTRESLIAISYGLPEGDLPSEKSPKNNIARETADYEPPIHDGDEKYRSKLISISYSPSPDEKVLPILAGET